MTKFPKLNDFLPNNLITRAEASKFFVKFAEQQGLARKVNDETTCSFSDIEKYQKSDLYQTMLQSCQYGLFNGSEGKFNPDLKKVKEARLILNQLATAGETNIQPLNQNINRIDMGRLFEGVNYKKNLEKKIAEFLAKH